MPCFPSSFKTELRRGSVQVHLSLLLLKQAEQPCEDAHVANEEILERGINKFKLKVHHTLNKQQTPAVTPERC